MCGIDYCGESDMTYSIVHWIYLYTTRATNGCSEYFSYSEKKTTSFDISMQLPFISEVPLYASFTYANKYIYNCAYLVIMFAFKDLLNFNNANKKYLLSSKL